MIQLPKKIYDAMITHAKSGYPNEACGILAGPKLGVASVFFPMRNMDESSISYFMDPKEQLKIFKKLREMKLEMVGIFHSHVASEASPSQKDIRLAFYPEVSYLIVSLSQMENPVLHSFKITPPSLGGGVQDEKVFKEDIQIVD